MKLIQEQLDTIRQRFEQMKTREDFLALLNYIQQAVAGQEQEIAPLVLKSVNWHANPVLNPNRSSLFSIRKKSGGVRMIHAPSKGLKAILRPLNLLLQTVYEVHPAASGFVPGRSIVDNAQPHVGKHYVYNLDLKDFFHSIDQQRVKRALIYSKNGLGKEREELAFMISGLCTHPIEAEGEVRNVLPQGNPTSPTLTNIICMHLDRQLTGLARRFGLTYTRYADDITFSSQHNVYKDPEFASELKKIIQQDQQLQINPAKTRLQRSTYRQEVTGLVVNDKVNTTRSYKKQIRMWLYYWEKYGYEKAQQIFERDYLRDKGHVKKGIPELQHMIAGKMEFLRMVIGDVDDLELKGRVDLLVGKDDSINNLLEVWGKEGVEKAMKLYYHKNIE